MIKGLMKLFGGADEKPAEETQTNTETGGESKSYKDLESFVDYVVRALVDNPGDVKVSSDKENDLDVINISCSKDDIGKIVGKKGRTIMAIRSLVSGAASRLQRKVTVEVLD